jgi:hypothetical protein
MKEGRWEEKQDVHTYTHLKNGRYIYIYIYRIEWTGLDWTGLD